MQFTVYESGVKQIAALQDQVAMLEVQLANAREEARHEHERAEQYELALRVIALDDSLTPLGAQRYAATMPEAQP